MFIIVKDKQGEGGRGGGGEETTPIISRKQSKYLLSSIQSDRHKSIFFSQPVIVFLF